MQHCLPVQYSRFRIKGQYQRRTQSSSGLQQPMYRVLKGEVNFYGKLNDLATPK